MPVVCKNGNVAAEKLIELKYEDLRACSCERCGPLADQKELDILRTFKQEKEIAEEAQRQAKELAAEIIATGKQVDGELKGMMKEIIEQELANAGIDMKGTLGRVIEKKMQFDLSAPSVNTRYGREQLSPQMKAFVHWARTGELIDRKVLSEGTNTAGGYLVPEEFRAEVIRKLGTMTAIRRSGARAFTVASDSIRIPTLESSGSGAWTGENQLYAESDPTFGEITLAPHKYTRLVRASDEMLADSALNVADLLTDIFAEDFAAAEDEAFWVGTGVGMPTGILTTAGIEQMAAGADFTGDDLINLIYALPRVYRQGAVFYMHSSAIQGLRLMKDANGAYIWADGMQNGEPARLLGYPVFEIDSQDPYDIDGANPGTALGTDIVFGNPRYYYIADRQGMRVERSTERFFEYGQVAFRADMRVDGEVALTDAFKKLTGVPV